jgi:glycosyltransferase involved in cell wall biosynthesis
VARGHAALTAGDRAEATQWLNRAHRLAPGDATVTLLLASAMIGADNVTAAALFIEVLAAADVRDAWLGLATARFLAADLAGARQALDRVLGWHASRPDAAALADQLARAIDAPGWCTLTGGGIVIVHPFGPVPIDTRIDGQPVAADKELALPPAWPHARLVTVMAGERHLIGSPIAPRKIGRIEGYAEAWEGGIRGWAWHPGDPDTDPRLSIEAGRHVLDIAATDPADGVSGLAPLAKPRSFDIPWASLPKHFPIHLRSRNGRDLLGSPIARCWPEAHETRPSAPSVRDKPRAMRQRNVVIVINSFGTRDTAQIEALLTSVDRSVKIVLANRAGEPWRQFTRDILFAGDIETAIAAVPEHDIVLLESGTWVPPGWLELLREAADTAPDIGTVTPFSNRGAAAYPFPEGSDLSWFAPETGRDTTLRLNKLTRRGTVTIPIGGGPCLFIRGDCLAEAGPLRPDLFAQGIGAQEDLCARASTAGWRNIALPGLFVGHEPQAKPAKAAWDQLHTRNLAILERRNPGFQANARRAAALLEPARRRLDIARWREGNNAAVILVTHDDDGGVERRVEAEISAHQAQGRRVAVLRPGKRPDGTVRVTVDAGSFPNLRFDLPREQPALLRLLRAAKPAEAQLHHLLNHDPSVVQSLRALGIPYDAHIHDYTWFCPRVALVGRGDRYCGEPDQAACEACVAELGGYLHEDIGVAAQRERSRDILFGARRVIAPSSDAAGRMSRHFPGLSVTVIPHEDDDAVPEPPPIPAIDGTVRVCVLGAIGLHKGFHVLLACAEDAARRGLDLTFVVAGTTIDDQRLMDTGRVFVTGPYQPREAVSLARAQGAALGFLPSIWPETWCLGLTELWRAGLRVAAFDIGAPAERIRRTGRGFLIPLGLSASATNDTLLEPVKGRSLLPIRRS